MRALWKGERLSFLSGFTTVVESLMMLLFWWSVMEIKLKHVSCVRIGNFGLLCVVWRERKREWSGECFRFSEVISWRMGFNCMLCEWFSIEWSMTHCGSERESDTWEREERWRREVWNLFLVLVKLLKSNSVLICELSLISTSNSST
jgi:hypothetical protein